MSDALGHLLAGGGGPGRKGEAQRAESVGERRWRFLLDRCVLHGTEKPHDRCAEVLAPAVSLVPPHPAPKAIPAQGFKWPFSGDGLPSQLPLPSQPSPTHS